MSDRLFAGLTFEQAINKYADTVTAVCIMRLRNWADAEDCFQGTFLTLHRKSPDFFDENHLKAWLIRVAINECVDYLRKNRRTIPLAAAPQQAMPKSDDESDISWALMQVDGKYREVLYLYYCERYKVDEIAKILGKNSNTVKSLLKRGRDILKRVYGGDAL